MNKKCAFDTCDRDAESADWCHAHYMQKHRGKAMTPLRDYKQLHTDEHGRVCTYCRQYKPWSSFYTKGKSAYQARCKVCMVGINVADNKARAERRTEACQWCKEPVGLTTEAEPPVFHPLCKGKYNKYVDELNRDLAKKHKPKAKGRESVPRARASTPARP